MDGWIQGSFLSVRVVGDLGWYGGRTGILVGCRYAYVGRVGVGCFAWVGVRACRGLHAVLACHHSRYLYSVIELAFCFDTMVGSVF